MSRFKMYTGVCLIVQAFAFLVMLILTVSDKKKRTTALALIAAGTGIAGAYLLIKGAQEYVPRDCCENADEEIVIDEDIMDDIDCSFSDEDLISDAVEEL